MHDYDGEKLLNPELGHSKVEFDEEHVKITIVYSKTHLLNRILGVKLLSDFFKEKPERTNTDDDYDNMMKKKKEKATKAKKVVAPKKKTKVVKPLAKRRDIRK